jgi:hypothetical protein
VFVLHWVREWEIIFEWSKCTHQINRKIISTVNWIYNIFFMPSAENGDPIPVVTHPPNRIHPMGNDVLISLTLSLPVSIPAKQTSEKISKPATFPLPALKIPQSKVLVSLKMLQLSYTRSFEML